MGFQNFEVLMLRLRTTNVTRERNESEAYQHHQNNSEGEWTLRSNRIGINGSQSVDGKRVGSIIKALVLITNETHVSRKTRAYGHRVASSSL